MVYCVVYDDGTEQCYRDSFWYSNTGYIVKWCILAGFFLFFMAWFVGGYLHAKSRMKKGLPLLGYHRWLVSYNQRKRYGQTPQNHFTFYASQPYGQRQDGNYAEPPPVYNGNDAPPQYYAPPGTAKPSGTQNAMEMPEYVGPPAPALAPTGGYPMGPQQTGVMGGGPQDVESQNQQLPPRPQQAKEKLSNFVSRFRR
ncbi:hypothetical protein K491DRAFT_10285 [Lophiostoma macrostomum CBS 122681]|uniref:Uncharacterized protein n=1 Tax=Lophiostoma macrostomum CBS 122681 TaxID=1314788 RepID=A0A6A6TUH9_9PLEO|nr:hypothetical protein K491DRAFT_10285 [Lophiostoma macrostomum CBS 122681]